MSEEIVDHRWVHEPFWRYGRQWSRYRMLVRHEEEDGRTRWVQAVDNEKPIEFVPVEPTRPFKYTPSPPLEE